MGGPFFACDKHVPHAELAQGTCLWHFLFCILLCVFWLFLRVATLCMRCGLAVSAPEANACESQSGGVVEMLEDCLTNSLPNESLVSSFERKRLRQ